MRLSKDSDYLFVDVSVGEAHGLMDGRGCGERGGLTPDAKVEVYPLSHRDPDARVTDPYIESSVYLRALRTSQEPKPQAELLGNEDLLVFVPDIVPHRQDIGGVHVPKSTIQTPGIEEDAREHRLGIVPRGGVIVNFDESIVRIAPTYRFLDEE